ncbi:MAG: ABC transporter permease [Clostridia bacterium]|nr:ABC transporter permease [Clostridia bacterium]
MKNKSLVLVKKNVMELVWMVGSILGFLLIWQIVVGITPLGRLLPSPLQVTEMLLTSVKVPIGPYTIQIHALYSLKRVMVGYSVAVVSGITIGIAMGLSKTFRAIFRPLFELIRPIPTVAWIPLAILWFGVDEMSKYFIVFYGAFANVVLSVYDGMQSVDPVLVGAAKMLGCTDRQVTFKVVIPSCIPYIFSGMQVALSASICSVVVAEMIKSTEGVGWIIHAGQQVANMTEVLTGMAGMSLFGILLSSILSIIERKACAWNIRNT